MSQNLEPARGEPAADPIPTTNGNYMNWIWLAIGVVAGMGIGIFLVSWYLRYLYKGFWG